MSEIVYVLVNSAMPDLVKVGRTENLAERVKHLSSYPSVPVPFKVHYACTVSDSKKAESLVHDAFGDHRINPKREFFRINPERVRAALKLAEIEDVTPGEDLVEDDQDKQTINREDERREPFSFSLLDIPLGAELTFVRDEKVTAEVVADRHVIFEGERMSVSKAAGIALVRDPGSSWSSGKVGGTLYWEYNGETLQERRLRMERAETED